MSFLHRVAGFSLRDRVRSSDIWQRLRVEPMVLRIERSQLRLFGHLARMPPGCLPREMCWAYPILEETRGQTKDMLERLYLFSGLGTSWCPPGELVEGVGETKWKKMVQYQKLFCLGDWILLPFILCVLFNHVLYCFFMHFQLIFYLLP